MNKTIIFSFVALSVLSACGNTTENNEVENIPSNSVSNDTLNVPVNADNSMNSLDWAGTYFGKLPCADCEGIETVVEIGNKLSYRITRKYIGKSNKLFNDTGIFNWNEEGNKITLQNGTGQFVKFFVGENYLLQLDADGNEITGDLASKYRLNKQIETIISSATVTSNQKPQKPTPKKNAIVKEELSSIKKDPSIIEGDKWILIELNGKSNEQKASEKQLIYFMLDSAQKYITGFGGCNQFFGGYKITGQFQIKFQKMTTTLMACDQMETESELLKALEKVDNYTLNGNILSLNKAKMAPLAKFERKN